MGTHRRSARLSTTQHEDYPTCYHLSCFPRGDHGLLRETMEAIENVAIVVAGAEEAVARAKAEAVLERVNRDVSGEKTEQLKAAEAFLDEATVAAEALDVLLARTSPMDGPLAHIVHG